MSENFIRAVLLQFSGIVGAGIFALPFVLYNSNFYLSAWGMFLITLITLIINVFYIQIICNTNGDHQLPGYAKKYLGSKFKYLAAVSLIVSGLGAELVYIKFGSNFFGILFSTNKIISFLAFILLVVLGYLVKSKYIKNILGYLPFVVVFIALLLFQIAFKNKLSVIGVESFNWSFFGVGIFALSGFTIIPEIEELLRQEANKEKKVILSSSMGLFLALFVYLIFCYSIIKISGVNLSEDSVSGLALSSPFLGKLISVLGLLATFKGATNFMLVFHEIFYRDFEIQEKLSKILAIGLALSSVLLFALPFVSTLGWIGSGSIFLSATIICLIRMKIKNSGIVMALVALIMITFILGFTAMI